MFGRSTHFWPTIVQSSSDSQCSTRLVGVSQRPAGLQSWPGQQLLGRSPASQRSSIHAPFTKRPPDGHGSSSGPGLASLSIQIQSGSVVTTSSSAQPNAERATTRSVRSSRFDWIFCIESPLNNLRNRLYHSSRRYVVPPYRRRAHILFDEFMKIAA